MNINWDTPYEEARKILATVASNRWCCGDGHGPMCIGCHSVLQGYKDGKPTGRPSGTHTEGCFVVRAQMWLNAANKQDTEED